MKNCSSQKATTYSLFETRLATDGSEPGAVLAPQLAADAAANVAPSASCYRPIRLRKPASETNSVRRVFDSRQTSRLTGR